jgi:hypothetical protein
MKECTMNKFLLFLIASSSLSLMGMNKQHKQIIPLVVLDPPPYQAQPAFTNLSAPSADMFETVEIQQVQQASSQNPQTAQRHSCSCDWKDRCMCCVCITLVPTAILLALFCH